MSQNKFNINILFEKTKAGHPTLCRALGGFLGARTPDIWGDVSHAGRGGRAGSGQCTSPDETCCCGRPNMQLLGCGVEGNRNMTAWAPSKRARSERIEAEADSADPRSRRSGLSGGAPKGARGQFRCDRRGLGACRQGDRAQDRQPRRPQSFDPTGDEHLLRAGSRAGRGAQASTPSRAWSWNANRRRPAFPRPNRSAFNSWAREPNPGPRSCAKTRSAPPTFPPRSSPPRSPHGRRTRSPCAFSIAKGTRFSAGRRPPAD